MHRYMEHTKFASIGSKLWIMQMYSHVPLNLWPVNNVNNHHHTSYSLVFCCYQPVYNIFNVVSRGDTPREGPWWASMLLSTPQMMWLHTDSLRYHVFSRVVSHCLPCSFYLPECPSSMVGPP